MAEEIVTPRLVSEGFVKNLKQRKANSAPTPRALGSAMSTYQGCLAADAHWRIPILAGQRYVVLATISTRCDSRGWSCDNWATRSGPEGVPGYFVQGSLGYPHSPIGTLIGAVSAVNAGESMDPTEAARIFAPAFAVGSKRDDSAPISGFLYLIFNDTWSWGDNKGSVDVSVLLN